MRKSTKQKQCSLIGPDFEKMCVKLQLFFYLTVPKIRFGTQENCVIETVILSAHNICFYRVLIFFCNYSLLIGCLNCLTTKGICPFGSKA